MGAHPHAGARGIVECICCGSGAAVWNSQAEDKWKHIKYLRIFEGCAEKIKKNMKQRAHRCPQNLGVIKVNAPFRKEHRIRPAGRWALCFIFRCSRMFLWRKPPGSWGRRASRFMLRISAGTPHLPAIPAFCIPPEHPAAFPYRKACQNVRRAERAAWRRETDRKQRK